jgi:hypothetical protein
VHQTLELDEQLNPKVIRMGADKLPKAVPTGSKSKPKTPFKATLQRTFTKIAPRR